MYKKQIILDVDGCILNWAKSFFNFMKDFYDYNPIDEDHNNYSIHDRMGGHFKKEEISELIKTFNDKILPDGRYKLKPYKKAEIYIPLIGNHCDIHILSSFTNNKKSKQYRTKNLKNIFGNNFAKSFTYSPLGTSKSENLIKIVNKNKKSPKDVIFYDDMREHLEVGLNLGFDTRCIRENGNYINGVTRLSDWEEHYKHMIKEKIIK